jgi:hypothetical protein
MWADMWAVCFRMAVNQQDDDTTSICEGFHSALKSLIRSFGSENLRLDRLLHDLLRFLASAAISVAKACLKSVMASPLQHSAREAFQLP